MGLSGRKDKQRIPTDPRNLSWADDAGRFGSSYLSKFGWDASKGLGVNEDGRTSHIKVAQKLDMMGIGAAHMKDPNGIAWKQNRDFENLLKRLNENASGLEVEVESESKAVEVEVTEELVEAKSEGRRGKGEKEKGEKSKKDKKRKYGKDEDEDRSEKTKRRKSSEEEESPKIEDIEMKKTDDSPPPPSIPKPPPRYRAHRARAIAAKNISSKSSAHISEILGIAPTPSTSASGSATPAEGKLTVISELEKITTSAKSVADYFKDKLSSRSSKSATPTDSSPTPGLGSRNADYGDERPVGGLGFSRLRVEVEETMVEEETMRMGLSKFSSLMSSTFLSATKPLSTIEGDLSSSKVEGFFSSKDEAEMSSKEEAESREERKRRRKVEKAKKAAAKAEGEAKEGAKDKKEKKSKKDRKKGGLEDEAEKVSETNDDGQKPKKKKKSKHRNED